MDYDVVVVGAGPAGSRAARDMARRGVRVALLEEHAAIGAPVHCSGLVTQRTLAEAEAPSDLVCNVIRGGRVHVDGAGAVSMGGHRVYAMALDRRRLDELLAQQAEHAGVRLLGRTRLTGVERENSHLRLRVAGPGGAHTLSAWLVIGADGAFSTVARALDLPPLHDTVVALGGDVAVPHIAPDQVEVHLGADLAPGWFGWLIPVGDGLARVGIGSVPGHNPRRLLEGMLARVPHLRAARLLRLQGAVIPVRQRRRIVAANAMLVGDAAGQVKPSSGGGIWTSLVAARTCARVAVHALERGDLSERSLRRYQTLWQQSAGRHLDNARALRDAFLRLRQQDMEALLAVGRDPAVRAVLDRHGDIDFPAWAFARLLAPWRLAALLPRVPLHLWPVAVRLGLRWLLHRP